MIGLAGLLAGVALSREAGAVGHAVHQMVKQLLFTHYSTQDQPWPVGGGPANLCMDGLGGPRTEPGGGLDAGRT